MREDRGFYILDESGEKPIHCEDADQWARWFENTSRRVEATMLGKIFISTVFLGLDHGFGSAVPILWECMVFRLMSKRLRDSLDCDRCAGNREQALAMHAAMVEKWEAILNLEAEIEA